jgi:hypothetical protein
MRCKRTICLHSLTASQPKMRLGLCCTVSQPISAPEVQILAASRQLLACLWRGEGVRFSFTDLLCGGVGELPAKCGGRLRAWNEGVEGGRLGEWVDKRDGG